jgi:hypothetical protein
MTGKGHFRADYRFRTNHMELAACGCTASPSRPQM